MSWMTQAREFIEEVRVESTKVSWPSRQEIRDSTIVVIVTVFFVMAFIFVVDRILNMGLGLLFQ